MQTTQPAYFSQYRSAKLTRDAQGVLLVEFHSNGRPLIALWIASGFAAAAFAGLQGEVWRAAADIVRYGGMLWLLKRSRYEPRVWIALLAALFAGTVAGLAWGYWNVVIAHTSDVAALDNRRKIP